ncbi:flagellar filament capping protein FliD [Demequina aestuarii]|uniref:flagellar filament capping protein FliD n=1 Tax=Demequina aestuarii TaxID=327095 RepID=UPI0009FFB9FE|nr:flagellar filament capping protein FliD [Demequina aestuarii]
MAAFGIDGLSSGLDTTSIIAQLMQIEAGPQTLLKRKQQTTQDVVTALQAINTKLRSLSESAGKAADPTSWKTFTATSTSTAATATASGSATGGSLTFSIGAVASTQVSLSAEIADGDVLLDPPTLTVKRADGTTQSVTATSGAPADIVSAINGAGLGVSATVVRVSSGGVTQSRIQFTSETSGTDGAFEVYAGDEAAVAGGGAVRLDASVAREASDASITLWKGSAYEQTYTQSSNTFTGLMTGVDVTVASASAPGDEVTITVAPDAAGVKSLVSGVVGALSVALADIDSRTATTRTTKDDGTTSVTPGLLGGEASVRSLRTQLIEAASYPVNGVSPSSVGVNLSRDGKITFDEATFAAAVAEDPQGTADFVQALAARIEKVADSSSDPYDGTLTQQVTNRQSLAERYADEVTAWDVRLEMRRATLQRTYSSLEVTLSNLSSQSSWLAGQLAQLPGS